MAMGLWNNEFGFLGINKAKYLEQNWEIRQRLTKK